MRRGYPILSRSGGGYGFMEVLFSLCVAFRSHVRPLTHTTPLDHILHTTNYTGTFLSRADVARMRHGPYPLPILGGDMGKNADM